jgi:hypothetical protein
MDVTYYSHTQEIKGKLPTAAAIAGGALLLVLPGGFLARLLWLGVAAGTAATFRSLTVNIESDAVRFQFGTGMIKKSIPLSKIKSATVIRTTPLQGWGIHWIGKGWLYNIYGLDAVDMEMADGGHVFLGTDQPQELAAVINQHCSKE